MRNTNVVGVAWGATLAAVVNELSASPLWRERNRELCCVPIAGELLEAVGAGPEVSSSQVAEVLARHPQGARSVTLRGIPCFIPTGPGDYFRRRPRHQEIFAEPGGLAYRLDTVLTSVGLHSQQNKLYTAELGVAGVDQEELAELSMGDMGGVLIENPGLTEEQLTRLAKVKAQWLGLEQRHLARVVEQAQRDDLPGVIVVAVGPNKAPIVSRCIELRLLNQLFVDDELARALLS